MIRCHKKGCNEWKAPGTLGWAFDKSAGTHWCPMHLPIDVLDERFDHFVQGEEYAPGDDFIAVRAEPIPPQIVEVIDSNARVTKLTIVPMLPEDSQARKGIPLCTGALDYFPKALAYVAMISKIGNDKHNPGEPMHHARGKSTDHPDCIARHLVDRGTKDAQGIRHSGYGAWRYLALLEEELEREEGLPLPRGARV